MSGVTQNGAPPTSDVEEGRIGSSERATVPDASYRSLPNTSGNPSAHDASSRTFPSTTGDSSSVASDRSAIASALMG